MSESTVLKTKFGNATLKNGYYVISSCKEGNHLKFLHRLIFEDFYKCDLKEEFPEGIHIHHIDGNKTNNKIWNLVPIPPFEHLSLHNRKENNPMWGKKHSEEQKQKMSEARKGEKNHMYGKHHTKETKRKISEANKGKKHSEETKHKISNTLKGVKNSDEHNKKISLSKNSTGFYRVIKRKSNRYPQGFLWCYVYYPEVGKRQKFISSVNLQKLKEKILSKGLEWFIVDLDKAKQTITGTDYNLKELV